MPPLPLSLRRVALAALLLALAACDVPRFEGPQIQSPPPGFTMNAQTSQERRLFPGRPVTHHDAWVRAQWGDFSGIYINAHPGSTSMEEMEAARQEALAARSARPDQVREFSPVERLVVDGREAMGWSELVRSEARGIEYVAYRAVVPYDTVSYAVEFVSGDPAFKIRTDSLRTIVATFAVGRVRYNVPLILVVAGVLLFLVSRARARSQERRMRHASMSLPKIQREEQEKDDDGTPSTAPPATPSSTPSSTRSATPPSTPSPGRSPGAPPDPS